MSKSGFSLFELELIQPHMAQKLVLRGEVGCTCVAREVSVVIFLVAWVLFGGSLVGSVTRWPLRSRKKVT